MYAKVFRQMYDGTLATSGPWEALVTFQQMLVLANDQGEVDMTPSAISRITTIPLNIIERGIGALSAPDPESRTPDEEGRRIVLLSEHRAWGWRVVNYLKYRAIQKEAERREYHRNYYHEKRKKVVESIETQHFSTDSTDSTDTEADAEAEEIKTPSSSAVADGGVFEEFWKAYPRKVGKVAARRAFKVLSADVKSRVVDAVRRQIGWEQWQREGGKYIPHPATWLNRGQYDDEQTSIGEVESVSSAAVDETRRYLDELAEHRKASVRRVR